MGDPVGHPLEERIRDGSPLAMTDADDAAHARASCPMTTRKDAIFSKSPDFDKADSRGRVDEKGRMRKPGSQEARKKTGLPRTRALPDFFLGSSLPAFLRLPFVDEKAGEPGSSATDTACSALRLVRIDL
jgi:hypothetical protein